jgi:glycosyltransferase involved in cell wall biosynthesis
MTAAPKPLRILVVLKTNEGGLWTLPQIAEMRKRGHDVTAILPAGQGKLRRALEVVGVPVLDSPFDFHFRPGPRLLAGLLRLRKLIRAQRADVVHYHLIASALAVRFATIGTDIRRVHGVAGPLYLENAAIRAAERVLVRLDHVTIGGSEHTASLYRSLGRDGHRVVAVPYGVDTERFRPATEIERSEARAALGYPEDEFLVVMVAYVYAPKASVHSGRGIKGHEFLLEAWREFVSDGGRGRLLIVGSGFDAPGEEHRSRLRARFDVDADLSVTWLDSVEDVRVVYAAADVSVSPSLSENHGAACEAGASGVPSIVTDAGALPEAVPPNAGWVVPRADSSTLLDALRVAAVEHEAGTLVQRGRAARQHIVQTLSHDVVVPRVVDVLESTYARWGNRWSFWARDLVTRPDRTAKREP